MHINIRSVWKYRRLFLTVYIHLAVLRVLYVVLLSHDDVLDVFHRKVITEGVVEEPLQLLNRQLLHVALQIELNINLDTIPHTHSYITNIKWTIMLHKPSEDSVSGQLKKTKIETLLLKSFLKILLQMCFLIYIF